jgi:hypothetical protein
MHLHARKWDVRSLCFPCDSSYTCQDDKYKEKVRMVQPCLPSKHLQAYACNKWHGQCREGMTDTFLARRTNRSALVTCLLNCDGMLVGGGGCG